ncbi:MAG: 4-hydroxy-3-methylbut-2-enyl diphosphate reductase [Candidatus Aminicenantes bacterium]|nr:4-hydroxy-3-methylbut-2-enyl diphosphate reductase [Candidatus Aminicenantes bacterium]
MEIIVANNCGLCYGVKRALRIAKETRERKKGKVFTLGDLIHNPRVVSELKSQGIEPAEKLGEIQEGTIIIRSHGVSPKNYRLLTQKKIIIIDATCPIVKKIQKLVERLAKEKSEIILVGNRKHPEIKGLIGYSQKKGIIIENEDQARKLPYKKRRAVLAQSTQDLSLFKKIVAVLIEKTKELRVYNTICLSTQTRQRSTSELASRVDTLFIVGGKNSSNTNKLFHISKSILANTHFVESAEEIEPEMLKKAKKIGISGGASTPPEAIEEVVFKIKNNFKHKTQRENVIPCQT